MSVGGIWMILPLLATLGLSYWIGLPIASFFFPDKDGAQNAYWRRLFAAPVLGTTTLFLAVYTASMLFKVGTDSVAWPVVGLLLLATTPFYWRVRVENWPRIAVVAALVIPIAILAGWHVIGPALQGRWDMAYSIGNDGARYLMMIEHLRQQAWVFGTSALDPLMYPLYNRPMQHYSGAMFASLWQLTGPQAYTIAAACVATLVSSGLLLCVECLAPPMRMGTRICTLIMSVLASGFGGVMVNIFYSGYLAQHFSIFLMVTVFAGLALVGNSLRFMTWSCFFGVALALGYSVTLTCTYALLALIPVTVLLILYRGGWRSFFLGYAALVLSVACGLIVSVYERQALNLGSVTGSRDGAFAWSFSDSVLRWSGLVNRYEYIQHWTSAHFAWMVSIGLSVALMALIIVAGTFRRIPAASIFIVVNVILGVLLLLRGQFYLANKMSIYWPFFSMLVVMCGTAAIVSTWGRRIVLAVVFVFFVVFWMLSFWRMSEFHNAVAVDRATTVDRSAKGLIGVVDGIRSSDAGGEPRIFVQDFSPERHLLLRQLLKSVRWQPARDPAIWAEFGYKTGKGGYPEWFDSYEYDAILAVREYPSEADLIDYAGDSETVQWGSGKFLVLGRTATALEFEGLGLVIRHNWSNDSNRRAVYAFNMASSKLRMVNRGNHRKVTFSIRFPSMEGKGPADILRVSGPMGSGPWSPVALKPPSNWIDYEVELELQQGINDIMFESSQVIPELSMYRISWR